MADYTRPMKHRYYWQLAFDAADRSTCLKRKYGAIIVKDDRIISTGYNGAPRGRLNCSNEIGSCSRMNVPHNTDYTKCRSVHAEMNAMLHANYEDMKGATLYLAGKSSTFGQPASDISPCPICRRMIINARIKNVVVYDPEADAFKSTEVSEWIAPEGDDTLLPETLEALDAAKKKTT